MYSNQQGPYHGRNRHSHHSQVSGPHTNSKNNQNNINMDWSCTECTFSNNGSKIRCDMCLTAKPLHTSIINPVNNINNINNNDIPSNNKKKSVKGGGGGIKFTTSIHNSPTSPLSTHKNGFAGHHSGIERVPSKSIIPSSVSFNPKKQISEQTIFERWMIAQIERQSGEQPVICIENNIMLTNLRRVRAPTTYETIQHQINKNTNALYENNLDAGDWTDDEEEELSGMYPNNSPRSQTSNNGFSPTPSDVEEEYNLNKSQNHLVTDVNDYQYNMKKSLDKRRRKKTRNKSKKKETIVSLWYKSQLELKQGRNPLILNKYNITLTNIRQHNPRFKDYQRRKSHHEKAATYLQVTGDKLHTNTRDNIANDDDEPYFSDTENDSQPNTPISISNGSRNFNYNNNNNNNNTPINIFNPYNTQQSYVE